MATMASNPEFNRTDSPSFGGLTVSGSIAAGHIGGKGSTPSVAVNAGAGTAASASLDANATDVCGKVTLVAGSGGWAAGAQCTITFAQAFNNAPYVQLEPANNTAVTKLVSSGVFITTTTTSFVITFVAAETGANTYVWFYDVNGN